MSDTNSPDEKQAPAEAAVAQAIYDAPNGIDGDQLADMLIDDDRITGESAEKCREQVFAVCQHAAVAAMGAHKAALAAAGYKIIAREPSEGMVPEEFDAALFDLHRADDTAGVWRLLWDRAE